MVKFFFFLRINNVEGLLRKKKEVYPNLNKKEKVYGGVINTLPPFWETRTSPYTLLLSFLCT